ncbi:MAG: hypothetical protein IT379_34000 [Deltaproteobacteria bacterium]|nr:hypothetical protein [Deltaproteobacteria bacterium]
MLDGDLRATRGDARQTTFDIGAGWLASVQLSRQWIRADGWRPFVTTSVSVSASGVTTEHPTQEEAFLSVDLRAGLVVGRTFFDLWTPYIAARVFGGPIAWTLDDRETTGGSRDHYQLGVGCLLALRWGFSLLFDWSMFGDRTLTVGLSLGV